MSSCELLIVGYAMIYNVVFWRVWRRARRHLRPDASLFARAGVGWAPFRADAYPPEGQASRRQMVWLAIAALPIAMVLVWLCAVLFESSVA